MKPKVRYLGSLLIISDVGLIGPDVTRTTPPPSIMDATFEDFSDSEDGHRLRREDSSDSELENDENMLPPKPEPKRNRRDTSPTPAKPKPIFFLPFDEEGNLMLGSEHDLSARTERTVDRLGMAEETPRRGGRSLFASHSGSKTAPISIASTPGGSHASTSVATTASANRMYDIQNPWNDEMTDSPSRRTRSTNRFVTPERESHPSPRKLTSTVGGTAMRGLSLISEGESGVKVSKKGKGREKKADTPDFNEMSKDEGGL
jgi:hypothetical protein